MMSSSEAGFTKGPWHATNHFDDDSTPCDCAYVLSEGYAGSICTVSVDNGLSIADGGNDSPPRTEAAANARLIAAAPELYEALAMVVRLYPKQLQKAVNLKGQSPFDIASAALRARGEDRSKVVG